MHISRSPPYTPSPVLSLSPCPQHPTRLAVSCPRHLSNHSQTGQRTPSSQANTAAQQREKRRASQCTSTRLMSASLPLPCVPALERAPLRRPLSAQATRRCSVSRRPGAQPHPARSDRLTCGGLTAAMWTKVGLKHRSAHRACSGPPPWTPITWA